MAPWWWFSCKPKHVGVVLLILKYFNNSTFFNVVCISWKLKCCLQSCLPLPQYTRFHYPRFFSSLPSSLESRDMSHWHQIAQSTGRLMKLAHLLLRLINFYNFIIYLLLQWFYISGILRSKSLDLKMLKILEALDPPMQFEIPEDGDPRLHLYENLKHSLITSVILFGVLHNHVVHFVSK